MPDRSAFWPPLPDWPGAERVADGLRVSVREPRFAWQLSGDVDAALASLGAGPARGPRDTCEGECYALRLAPDSVLLLGDEVRDVAGIAAVFASDLADGVVGIDIEGPRAVELMTRGCGYPFTDAPELPQESARMLFAGLRVVVSRRPEGWRLHIERPWAAALWHWLDSAL